MEEEKNIENETFLDKFINGANDSITILENINRLILDDDNELENLIDNLLSKKKISEKDQELMQEINSKLVKLQDKFRNNNNKWEKIIRKLEENQGQQQGGKKRKSSKRKSRKSRKSRKTRKNKKSRKQKKRKSRKYK
jgi:hypothetical protein